MRKIIEGGYGVGLIDANEFETYFCEPESENTHSGGGSGQPSAIGGEGTYAGGGPGQKPSLGGAIILNGGGVL